MPGRLGGAALAAVLFLAGCAGGLAPTPTPETRADPVVAPGLNATGITDFGRLLEAHRSATSGLSYTLDARLALRDPDGDLRGTTRTVFEIDDDHERFEAVQTGTGAFAPPDSIQPLVTAYSDGNVTYVKYELGGGPEEPLYFSHRSNRFDDSYYFRDFPIALGPYVAEPERSTVRQITEDGWLAYRVTTVDEDSGVSVALTVDSFGFIRRLRTTLPAETTPYGPFLAGTVTYDLEYGAVGNTTVSRPAWVDAAFDGTEPRNAPWRNESSPSGSPAPNESAVGTPSG